MQRPVNYGYTCNAIYQGNTKVTEDQTYFTCFITVNLAGHILNGYFMQKSSEYPRPET